MKWWIFITQTYFIWSCKTFLVNFFMIDFYDGNLTINFLRWKYDIFESLIHWTNLIFSYFRLSDDRIYDRERDRSIGVSNNYDRDGPYVKRNSIGGYLDDNDRDTYSSNRNSRSRDTRPGYNRNVLNSSGYQDGLDR